MSNPFEQPVQKPEKQKKLEKNPFEILTAELAGKTHDELTPEQRETEDEYCEKCFRDLMQLINDDNVLSHGTLYLNSVLENGILSARRLRWLQLGAGRDTSTQENARRFTLSRVRKFLEEYKQRKQKLITEEEFYQKRQEIIDEFPDIGRERVRDYFENILPKGIEEGWFNNSIYVDGGYTQIGAWQKMSLSKKKQFLKAFEIENLAGMNTVSTIGTPYFKKKFISSGFLQARGSGYYTIFFDRPPNKQLIDMSMFYGNKRDTKEEDSFDIGVFAKVNKNNFRAIELNNVVYDETRRCLYFFTQDTDLLTEDADDKKSLSQEVIKKLTTLQKAKISIFADSLEPLPPLESIAIVRVPYDNHQLEVAQWVKKSPDFGYEKDGKVDKYEYDTRQKFENFIIKCGDSNPKRLSELGEENKRRALERVKGLIKENHWNWYEKYGKKTKE